jgi:hypothetical protein
MRFHKLAKNTLQNSEIGLLTNFILVLEVSLTREGFPGGELTFFKAGMEYGVRIFEKKSLQPHEKDPKLPSFQPYTVVGNLLPVQREKATGHGAGRTIHPAT